MSRIELWIEPENAPSLRVAERAGFTREGLLRSFAVIDGRRRDMLMYSRIAGDPPGSGDRVGEHSGPARSDGAPAQGWAVALSHGAGSRQSKRPALR